MTNPRRTSLSIHHSGLFWGFGTDFIVLQRVELIRALGCGYQMKYRIVPSLSQLAHVLDTPSLQQFVPLGRRHVRCAVHQSPIAEQNGRLPPRPQYLLEPILHALLQFHHSILNHHAHTIGTKVGNLESVKEEDAIRLGTGYYLESTLSQIRRQPCKGRGLTTARTTRQNNLVERCRTQDDIPHGGGVGSLQLGSGGLFRCERIGIGFGYNGF
mmetsp:Transcript_34617/g.69939  ORF Transcript_34617/g.69939 Transcript_34617/m.69939 type:complete len:213 (-) Transcript_34617:1469-2107(-)